MLCLGGLGGLHGDKIFMQASVLTFDTRVGVLAHSLQPRRRSIEAFGTISRAKTSRAQIRKYRLKTHPNLNPICVDLCNLWFNFFGWGSPLPRIRVHSRSFAVAAPLPTPAF